MSRSSDEPGVDIDHDTIAGETEFFRSLVEHGSDAIISVDRESTIRYANQSVERVFGYTPDELVGEPLTTLMPDRFHADHFEALDRYLETGERRLDWNDIELPAEHADGHEVPLSITFEEHEFDGERLFSGIMRDISERTRHERNLKKLQAATRDLMESPTPEAVGERVVDAAVETLGFPLVSLYLHDETADVLRPVAHSDAVTDIIDDIPVFGEGTLAWKAFRTGERQTYSAGEDEDATVLRPDGPVESEYVFPLDDHGCLLVADTDPRTLDSRTLTLVEILVANTEAALDRAAREAELARQNERLERFASIVSHDLRDPLQTARATTAVARAGDEEALDELDEVYDRMAELIDDVLTLAKQGQAVGETEPTSLAALAEDAWSTAGTEAASLSVEDDLTLESDPERLRTLLENLFRNSIDHGATDGDVTIRVGRLDDRSGFYVEDDGAGFDDAEQGQLFEYGYTTDEGGTGFGLSIVRDIVDAHGWSVTATTGRDGGARFEVTTANRAGVPT